MYFNKIFLKFFSVFLSLAFFLSACAGRTDKRINPNQRYSATSQPIPMEDGKIPLDIILDARDVKVVMHGDVDKDMVIPKIPNLFKSYLNNSFRSVTLLDDHIEKYDTAELTFKIDLIEISIINGSEGDSYKSYINTSLRMSFVKNNQAFFKNFEFSSEDLEVNKLSFISRPFLSDKSDSENDRIITSIMFPFELATVATDVTLHFGTLFLYTYFITMPYAYGDLINEVTMDAYEDLAYELSQPEYRDKFHALIQDQTAPASLIATLSFTDTSAIIPNNTIDASENSFITAKIENTGQGTAFDVNLEIDSDAGHIDVPEVIEIGGIPPGESRQIEIPITADAKLSTGTAVFKIRTNEKRGYSARPVQLEIPTAGLQSPDLMIADCKINDASGLAKGDGDMTAENNETIELETFIRNTGVGNAFNVSIKLKDVTPGIDIVNATDTLAVIGPNTTNKAALAFRIPRIFSEDQIKYTVVASDTRGMSSQKTFTIPFTPQTPDLQMTWRVVDERGEEVPGLENGKSYRINIVPKNAGKNTAEEVRLALNKKSNQVQIGSFNGSIGKIEADERAPAISIPIILERGFQEKTLTINAALDQDSFPGISKTITMPVMAKKPELKYQITLLNGLMENTVAKATAPRFRVSVSNNGNLSAEDVTINLSVNRKDIDAPPQKSVIGSIQPGENQYKDFTFFVPGFVDSGDLPISLNITQADFNSLNPSLTFAVEDQTTVVQRVKGSATNQAIRTMYSGAPKLYVISPVDNAETMEDHVSLRGSIITFGKGNALDDFKVRLNGQPLSILTSGNSVSSNANVIFRQVKEDQLDFGGKINLKTGENTIRIEGRDRNNQPCSQTVSITKKARLGDIYAVVIGISEFGNVDYNLKYAHSDAEKFYNFLKSEKGGALPDSRVKLLTNHEANREAVIDALSKFLGRTTRDDIVEIYLATHGLPDSHGRLYYLCYDTDIEKLNATGFSDRELTEIINTDINAGKVILYLDACHSELSGISKALATRGIEVYEVNDKINYLAAELSKLSAAGVATFSATSASGYAKEGASWDGGVFTHCLINGLTGYANTNNDEWVTIKELDTYLTRQILDLTNGEQQPKVISNLPADVTPLAKVK